MSSCTHLNVLLYIPYGMKVYRKTTVILITMASHSYCVISKSLSMMSIPLFSFQQPIELVCLILYFFHIDFYCEIMYCIGWSEEAQMGK